MVEECPHDSRDPEWMRCIGCIGGSLDSVELSVSVDLIPYGIPAKGAAVLVFIPFGQDEKERFPDRNSPPAFHTIKLSGLEFIKARLYSGGGAFLYRWKTKRLLSHYKNPP